MNKFPLCRCGCGKSVNKIENKFILGHNRRNKSLSKSVKQKISLANKGKILSKETVDKMSNSLKGRTAWNKGKIGIYSEKTLEKMSKSQTGKTIKQSTRDKLRDFNTGKTLTEDHKKKISMSNRGKHREGHPVSEETKSKIRNALLGKKLSDEHKEKLSKVHMGLPSGRKGKKCSEETKEKLRFAQIKLVSEQYFNGEPLIPTVGKKERVCLNELQKYCNYKIIRQFPTTTGHFLDGFIKEKRLVISFYENFHSRQKIHDMNRQQRIEEKMNCKFFIVHEKEWDNNKDLVIQKFQSLVDTF